MNNKKGFTLIELMAVIVLVAIITAIGTYSIIGLQSSIDESMWRSRIDLIENSAKRFGEDNKVLLTNTCNTSEGIKTACLEITVQTLFDRNYISSKEKDEDGNKIMYNASDEIVNGYNILVYIENELYYAELVQPE